MSRQAATAGALVLVLTASVFTDPPVPPVSGSDFQAQRAFVGDPLLGLDAGSKGNLFTLNADEPAAMASTTKSFTLLLAAEAVMAGVATLDDLVTISAKAASVNAGHAAAGELNHSTAGLPAGEQLRFEDLLYAMMLPSGADASIAIAQHVAVSYDPTLASESDAAQEQSFVNRMNLRSAALGLASVAFFNPYGGDHFHADDNTPGATAPHVSSTRDMVRWFYAGMQYSLFRQVAGFQGTYSFNAVDGTAYSFGSSFGYPGTQGQKGGTNNDCLTCVINQSRRIGRDVLMAYTQGQGGDGVPLLDYGFASLFHPTEQAESGPWTEGFVDHALACVDGAHAASVVVRPNGQINVLVWALDLDNHSIVHANPVVTPRTPGGITDGRPGGGHGGAPVSVFGAPTPPRSPDGFAIPTTPPPPDVPGTLVFPGRGEPPSTPGFFNSPEAATLASKARLSYAGTGNLAVVAETNNGIYLHSYGITQSKTVVLRDTDFVGSGTDARVLALHSTLLVTAHRTDAGLTRVMTWHLNPLSGMISSFGAIDGAATQPGELEISGRPGLSIFYDVLVAGVNAGGTRQLTSVSVHRVSGDLEIRDTNSFGGASAKLALARVPQVGNTRQIHALSFRDGQGRLAVASYEIVSNTGIIVQQGVTSSLTTLGADASLAMASYAAGGVLIALQGTESVAIQALDVWALDPSATSAAITPNRVGGESAFQHGILGVCRAPDDAAEGDFLLARGGGVEALRLQAWRSAPRE